MDRGVCVVTGGSRGIGAATVRRAAADGWTVCLSYRREASAAEALADDVGGRAVQADIADEGDVVALFAAADDMGPVRGAVASAGIVDRTMPVRDMTAARMRRMLEVNTLGTMLTAREAVRRMVPARSGSIVLVGSVASRVGSPGQYVDYAASKGAVDSFTLGLAKEVAAEGVRVSCVRPGIIDTAIHADSGQPNRVAEIGTSLPMGRAGHAEEVAAAIVWLLSEDSSYVSGTFLDVSGAR
jgi:NAD(P)-dependent dehydrogenase (short-subunit alcohol dehydrogenase family)